MSEIIDSPKPISLFWYKAYVASVKKLGLEDVLDTELTPEVEEKLQYLVDNDSELNLEKWWGINPLFSDKNQLENWKHYNTIDNLEKDSYIEKIEELGFYIAYEEFHHSTSQREWSYDYYFWQDGVLLLLTGDETGYNLMMYYNLKTSELMLQHPHLLLPLGANCEQGNWVKKFSVWAGAFQGGQNVLELFKKFKENDWFLEKWVKAPDNLNFTSPDTQYDWDCRKVPFTNVVNSGVYELFPDGVKERIGSNPFKDIEE